MEKKAPLKIIELRAENVKRLKAVRVKPDSSLIIVGGRNGAGKSSLLDSIAYALGGKDLCPTKPIRDGEERGYVYVDLGELTIERTWTEGHSYLTVKNREGFEAKSPQALLDKLIGPLAFDPLAYMQMSTKDQATTLMKLVGLDFSELNTKRTELYDSRRLVGRDLKALLARFESSTKYEDVPDEPIFVSDLMEKLHQQEEHNRSNEEKRAELASMRTQLKDLQNQRVQTEIKIKELNQQLVKLNESLSEQIEWIHAFVADGKTKAEEVAKLVDFPLDDIRTKIQTSDEINEKVRSNEQYEKLNIQVKQLDKQVQEATTHIDKIDTEKEQKLSKAKFPIKGLAFDDEGVTYNKIPFKQASQAEALRISVAMGLAMNPKLRVMLIRDGSLLDEKNLELIRQMAEENDAQIWLERVAKKGDQVSIMIEDGSIVG